MSRQEGAVLHHVDKSFWKHVEKIDDGRMGCKFCGCLFPKATSISRIKFHLAGLTGRGVRVCGQVPQDVQDAALAAIDGPPEKKLETGAGSSNNEVTNAISSLAQQQNNEMMMAHQREDLSLEDWMARITDEDEEPLVIGSFHERPSFNQADEPHVDRSFWEYAEKMDDGRMGCKFCGCLFPKATSISRIKFHLAGLTGRGVRVCGQVPQDVQDAALAAIDGPPEKKLETGAGSSNNEVTNAISSLAQQQNNEMMMAHQREDLSLEDWMASITDEDEEPLVIGSFHERPSFNQADEPHVDRSFWEYAEKMDDGRMGCKFCGCLFPKATSITRIKFHLAGLTGRGVRICGQVPQDVQDAALAAIDGPLKKKLKTGAGSGNNEVIYISTTWDHRA